MSTTESQWPAREVDPLSDTAEGLDSAVMRATLGARMFQREPYRIGRFTVLRRLGAGGMGVVYLGYDPELAREVAIKVLRSETGGDPLRSDRARGRVRSEAQAMAKLRHPHVVMVHEVGEHDGGLFVAMEYVRGTTLRQWATTAPRSVAETVVAYVAAGRGLAAAHDAGIVHRDFKPDNVLIGDDGRVLVTDFGLAQLHSIGLPTAPSTGVDPDGTTLSSGSGGAGTPAYMAPECLRGQPATAASDQFSFCVALYEALWGSRPFGDSIAALALTMRGTAPPQPPARPATPSAVRNAVLRGLSRDPTARFVSMHELLRVLGHVRGSAALRWFGVTSVVALAGIATWQAQAPAPCGGLDAPMRAVWNAERRSELAQAFASAGRPYAEQAWSAIAARTDTWTQTWIDEATNACHATEIQRTQSTERLDLRVACLDQRRRALVALLEVFAAPDDAAIERGVQAVERLPQPADCADLEALDRRAPAPIEPTERAAYDAAIDRVAASSAAYETGHYAAAKAMASDAVSMAVTVAHRPTEAAARLVLGDVLDELAQTDEARRELERAIAAAEAGGADEISARAWLNLAYVEAWSAADVAASERALGLAAAEIEALGNPHDLHATATKLRASILAVRGHFEQAEPLARAAVDELVLGNAGTVRVAAARLAVGTLLYEAGRWDEALNWTRDAQREFTAALGAEHPSTLSARSNAANVLGQLRRLDESIAEHREVLTLRERSLGAEHPSLGANLNAIATTYYYRGQFAEAVEFQRRAVDLSERTRGPEHPDSLIVRENLAAFLLQAGRTDEALTLGQQVLDTRRRVQGPEHPDLLGAIDGVAHTLQRLGRVDEAATRYAEALALGERALGPDHPLLLDSYRGAAEVALARGHADESYRLATRGLTIAEQHYGAEHTKLVTVLRVVGDAAQARGAVDEAARARARAVGIEALADPIATPRRK